MAPNGAVLPKRKPKENNFIFDLGVRGRKTGLTLPDTGIRDEHGLEPMDGLFSSPAKPKSTAKAPRNVNATLTSEEDMEMVEKLAFSNNGNRRDHDDTTEMDESGLIQEDSFQMVNGGDDEPMPEPEESEIQEEVPEEEEEELEPEPEPVKKGKRKAAEVDTAEEPTKNGRRGRPKKADQPVVEEEPELPVERPSKRPRRSLDQALEAAKKPAGRPKKIVEAPEPEPEPEEPQPAKKQMGRPKKAVEKASEPEPKAEPKSKAAKKAVSKLAQTTAASATAKAKPRKQQLQTIDETDSPEVKKGPPIPRSRGLLILRRETPAEGTGFKQTRSGRNSIKPVAYWKNERIDYDEDEEEDNWGKFCLPKIKGVVRVDEVEQEKRSRAKSTKPSKSKKRRTATEPESEGDEVAEPWETEPGEFVGEVRLWDPEDPTGVQTEEQSDQIALSSAAIVTRDVKNGSFKFAKTLTLPFFGSGMVDLPPGGAKKPKSSRKMQMVFFVYYGRVKVTVNDNTFRIGKGGMWQVPRGNFYSIENDYDNPARLFFAQGCERDEEDGETQ
ncbi:putative centromere protein 3 [Halenospora varia]|nr:putative centromere protein 3 [Halenospora varia]